MPVDWGSHFLLEQHGSDPTELLMVLTNNVRAIAPRVDLCEFGAQEEKLR
jgi:hypothetical protein